MNAQADEKLDWLDASRPYVIYSVGVCVINIGSWMRRLGVELVSGFNYVLKTPHIAILFALVFITSFFLCPVIEMFPAFVGTVFNGDGAMLSIIEVTFGVGGLLGGFLMLWLSTASSCAATLLFACGFPLTVAVPAVFFMGATATMSFIGLQAVLQLSCAPALRGKVLSLYQLTFCGLLPLGALLLGWGGERYNLCVAGAAGAIAATLAISGLSRLNKPGHQWWLLESQQTHG